MASEASILCPSAFAQGAVTQYLATMPWQEQIKVYREVYRERRDALLSALQDLMPAGTTWTRPKGGLFFDVTLDTGKRVTLDADDFWYVPGMSLDGKTGVSLLTCARESLATTISADRAAGKMFSSGAMVAGMVTPADDEDLTEDVDKIRAQVNSAVGGWENAGQIARRITLKNPVAAACASPLRPSNHAFTSSRVASAG